MMAKNSFKVTLHCGIAALVVLFVVSCGLLPPEPGTVIAKSNIRQLNKDGVIISVYSYVQQSHNEYFPEHYAACRLDRADFSSTETINIEIGGKSMNTWFNHDFKQSDLNRWVQCYSKPNGWGNRRNPILYTRIGQIKKEGCATYQQLKTLTDGSRVVGTVCGTQLQHGTKVTADGRLSLCHVINDDEPYDGWTGKKRARCIITGSLRCCCASG